MAAAARSTALPRLLGRRALHSGTLGAAGGCQLTHQAPWGQKRFAALAAAATASVGVASALSFSQVGPQRRQLHCSRSLQCEESKDFVPTFKDEGRYSYPKQHPYTGELRRTLYPPLEPFQTGRLRVDETHELYFEVSGNPEGKPVVFLHGGPGSGAKPKGRRFFDPAKYKIVLFDQRGAGKSTPHASLENNTTWHLVEDIERLRVHLDIEKWLVFGGSWGACLSLAYAETYPERVKGLILRGIFMLRDKELQWYYQEGASYIFPDEWEPYEAHIPPAERGDMIAAYHRRLTSGDEKTRLSAAIPWTTWECSTSELFPDQEHAAQGSDAHFALAFARIENHYFFHKGWFTDEQLLKNVDRIRHIPTVIVQGRYDVVCPARSAWDLHRAFPEARLNIMPDAGHSGFEPGIASELVKACDEFASL